MANESALPEPISAERAARLERRDLRVPDGQSRTVGPFDEETRDTFSVVAIESFDDLRLLGFVHPELDVPAAVAAIRADNLQHRTFVEETMRTAAATGHGASDGGCGCGGGCGGAGAPRLARSHTNLIDLLQPLADVELRPTHPMVSHTRSYVSRFAAGALKYVGMFNLFNITVGDGATLTMSPSVSLLWANDITIGSEGRLRFAGSGVKVKCLTLNGPGQHIDPLVKIPVGWTKELFTQGAHS